jgi:hypothetical protein
MHKAAQATFIGYESRSEGYRLRDNNTRSAPLSLGCDSRREQLPNLLSGDEPRPAPYSEVPAIAIPHPIAEAANASPFPCA